MKTDILNLFIKNDNVKIKANIGNILVEESFLKGLETHQMTELLKFVEELLYGTWESKILDYKETKNIENVKSISMKYR